VIARLEASYAFAHFNDNASAFVAQNDRKEAFRVITGQGEGICMANTRVGDLDQHFACARWFDVDLYDLKRFTCFEGYCSTRFHMVFLQRMVLI